VKNPACSIGSPGDGGRWRNKSLRLIVSERPFPDHHNTLINISAIPVCFIRSGPDFRDW